MKSYRNSITFALILSMSAVNTYASCRAGDAASKGAKAAYEEATTRAEQNEQKEKSSSDSSAQCISGIGTITAGGAFPTWDSVYKAVRSRVCAYANQQINTGVDKINGKISKVYQTVNGQINNTIGNTGAGDVIGSVNTGNVGLQTNSNGTGNVLNTQTATQFWSKIWN